MGVARAFQARAPPALIGPPYSVISLYVYIGLRSASAIQPLTIR